MDVQALTEHIERGFPFHALLGVKVVHVREGIVRLRLPFRPELIGHASRNILHGGVVSTLADVCGGFAVWTRCNFEDQLATITLSVDYLRPAAARDLYAEGTVRLLGNRVGNAHVVLWSEGQEDAPVAEGRGVYNIRRGDGGKEREAERGRRGGRGTLAGLGGSV